MATTRIILVANSTTAEDNKSIIFKEGFGPGDVKLFKDDDIGGIVGFITTNPSLPVVLFDNACVHSSKILSIPLFKKELLFLVEPPISPLNTKSVKESIENGLPATNIQVGPVGTRGYLIVDNPRLHHTPEGETHIQSLASAGKRIAKMIPPPTQDQLTGELDPNADELEIGTEEKYTVVKGDYLYKIARKFPIDGVSEKKRVYQIYDANPFMKARRIESNNKTYYHGENFLEKEDLLFPDDILMIPGYGTPIKSFQISGTVVDSETDLPIKGADVKTNIKKPGFANETITDNDGNFSIAGKYTPPSTPIRIVLRRGAKGAEVKELQEALNIEIDGDFGPLTEKSVKTFQEKEGLKADGIVGFKTWTVIDNIGSKNNPTFIFDILANHPKYNNARVTPFNLDQTIKDSAGIIRLDSLISSIKAVEIDLIAMAPPEIKMLKTAVSQLDPSGFAIKEMGNQVMERLKTQVLPQVLQLLVAFGIGKIQDAVGKKLDEIGSSCPSNLDELNDIIKRKNQLTQIIQQIFDMLQTIKAGVDAINKVVTVLDIVLDVLKVLIGLLPVAGFGLPDPPKVLLTPGAVFDKMDKILGKIRLISGGVLLTLSIITAFLGRILQYLGLLDALVQKCYIEGAIPNEVIDPSLFPALDNKDKEKKIINGFVFSTEMEKGNTEIKRKRAVAKNQAGITLLKGEWSFSSNDQILIDELIFYIQSNDLKAD